MNATFRIELDCSDRVLTAIETLTKVLQGHTATSVAPMIPTPIVEEPKRAPRKKKTEEKHEEPVSTPIVFDAPKEVEKKNLDNFDVEHYANEENATVEEPITQAQEEKHEEKAKEITDADLRAAMKACRERVLGEKINDGVLKSSLNSLMKDKVHELGYDTSTAIPQDKRQGFLDFLKVVTIDTNDNAPF